MQPLSNDLRKRILDAVDKREGSRRKLAARFSVNTSTITKLLQLRRQTGSFEPRPHGGGVEPTNTDANLVLGRLNSATFLGGELPLAVELARSAILSKIAEPLGMSVEQAAEGILRVANANMVDATKLISVERGRDPRDFALMGFGGAGPVHAAYCARELSIPKVLIPRFPGLASAFGQLRVELRDDYQLPLLLKHVDMTPKILGNAFQVLESKAREAFEREGIATGAVTLERSVDLKYYPQTTYLNIPVPPGPITEAMVSDLVQSFLHRHEQEFGYSVELRFTTVEFVNARLVALGPAPVGELHEERLTGSAEQAKSGTRSVHWREIGGWTETNIYARENLHLGARFKGPAIVEQPDSTTVVPPGAEVEVDAYGNLIIDVSAMAQL
jgi:N-methylhydantoinase A